MECVRVLEDESSRQQGSMFKNLQGCLEVQETIVSSKKKKKKKPQVVQNDYRVRSAGASSCRVLYFLVEFGFYLLQITEEQL